MHAISLKGIAVADASVYAATLVNSAFIFGQLTPADKLLEQAAEPGLLGFSATFQRTMGVECHLFVSFARTHAASEGHEILKPNVHVQWTSTRHDVQSAVANLALYHQVVQVAALVQAALDREMVLNMAAAATESGR